MDRPCLIGLPFDAKSSFLLGAAQAPPLIRDALRSPSANPWSESLVDTSDPERLADVGDLVLPETDDARALIEAGIGDILARGMKPLALGGDHSVTYPILRAVAKAHGPVSILHIDAHADLYDALDGDRYSHGSPFARIMEEGLASRLVQVGIRTLTPHQLEQAERFGVEIITMQDFVRGVRPEMDGTVYISFDMDGLDPAHAPGVSHWEPGGLTTRDVLDLLQHCAGTVIGADVVEFNPVRDATGRTAMVAARITRELAGRMNTIP